MKSVIIRGPLLSQSGYGNHARQVFRWILNKHPHDEIRVQVLPWGNTSWYVDPSAENGLIGEIMNRTGEISKKFDVSFQIQLPNEWDPNIANFNVGISAVVEADKCNPAWIDACNRMSFNGTFVYFSNISSYIFLFEDIILNATTFLFSK